MIGSPVDIAIVAGVALLLFGPKKMPELGRALGQGIGNFKRALTETADELKTAASAEAAKAKDADKPAATAEPTPVVPASKEAV